MLIPKEKQLRKNLATTPQTEGTSQKPLPKQTPHHVEEDPITWALGLSVPSWPLQNTVAVNPFWNQKNRPFDEVMQELSSILHLPLYMSLDYYLSKYQEGAISHDSVQSALAEGPAQGPQTVEDLLHLTKLAEDESPGVLTFAEHYDKFHGTNWQRTFTQQASKYAAGYFDDAQALVPFPWRGKSFWQAWYHAQATDQSMSCLGLPSFVKTLETHFISDPKGFIQGSLESLGLNDPLTQSRYLSRVLAQGLGWASQFKYGPWQKSLGYGDAHGADCLDYLAVLVAYDATLAQALGGPSHTKRANWLATLKATCQNHQQQVNTFDPHKLWQMASEFEYQIQIASQIKPVESSTTAPKFQIVMCIDVRSEMIRRALEGVSREIQTLGFAGFFGVPFDYKRSDEHSPSHRLPVLLSPAFVVEQTASGTTSEISGLLRHLRKAPLASFSYVEFFGMGALLKTIWQVVSGAFSKKPSTLVPKRFRNDHTPQPLLDLEAMTQRCAIVLRHMGLTKNFGRLVLLTGHGSANTNNAFQSSLDCGACGGHSGDINARVLAGMLNRLEVRKGLAQLGIHIPDDTLFVAAVHETVTDRIYLLQDGFPQSHAEDFAALQSKLDEASELASKERQDARSIHLDPCPQRRSANWSEIRPEWGLAGNACFVVAPRAWTKSINFSSRAFLHDYDADRDEAFATLELIMTAPMVVTNWINLQYYASTVAPSVYGAGNKTLHNLVNESGVQEGNGGDLRIGLPLQSVHDGESFVHEPLRLSVFLAAPISAIENILEKHQVVRDLANNEWLYILHIDSTTGTISRRTPDGTYKPVPIKADQHPICNS